MIPDLWIELAGYLASALVFTTFCMRRLLPLRLLAIASNAAFILYALLAGLMPILLLHATLLPLNLWRGIEALRDRVRVAYKSPEQEMIDALLPTMQRHDVKAGASVFTSGDAADALFYLAHGKIFIVETGTKLGAGALLGEAGLFTPARRRTTTARCLTDCTLYAADRKSVERIAQTKPAVGLYLAERIAARLVPQRTPAQLVLCTPVAPPAPQPAVIHADSHAMNARG